MLRPFIILILFIPTLTFGQPFKLSDKNVKKGQFIALWEIYFEAFKPNLQTKPQLQLDSVNSFLINNKDVLVEIGVHTDFRGDDKLNLKLSQDRADTLKKYLIKKGIDPKRITAIGFGETKPVIEYEDWKTLMDTHRCGYYGKTNRRVTVVVK